MKKNPHKKKNPVQSFQKALFQRMFKRKSDAVDYQKSIALPFFRPVFPSVRCA
jgi:hypothetical protein